MEKPTEKSSEKKFAGSQQLGRSDENRKKLTMKKATNNKGLIKAKENSKLLLAPQRDIGIPR